MKAIILAGGKATRLNPLSMEMPKSLITVHRRPIINYLVKLFRQYGVKQIAVVISPIWKREFSDWRRRYFSKAKPHLKIVIEEEPMGTFGGVQKYLKKWIGQGSFFLSNGDELKRLNLRQMKKFHRQQKKQHGIFGTIALVKVPNPQDYGVAVMDGDKIKKFVEKPAKPPSQYISSGFYLLEAEVFDHAPAGQNFVMIEKDVFPALAEQGRLAGYKFDGPWFDCGTFERWEEAIRKWEK